MQTVRKKWKRIQTAETLYQEWHKLSSIVSDYLVDSCKKSVYLTQQKNQLEMTSLPNKKHGEAYELTIP